MNDPIPFVDPHIHLWDPLRTPRSASPLVRLLGWNRRLLHAISSWVLPPATQEFIGRPDYVAARYLPADYAADHAADHAAPTGLAVEGYVYVQAGWHGRGRWADADETRWIEQVAQHTDARGPSLVAIVAAADLRRDDLCELLTAHKKASPRVRGIRDMLAWSLDPGLMNFARSPGMMGDPRWRRGFASLADHDLSFDAWAYLDQIPALDDLLGTYPEVRVVLDHGATPVGAGGVFAGYGVDEAAQAAIRTRWRDAIARLARHPQLHIKISGMFMPCLGWGLHSRQVAASVDQVQTALAPFVEHIIENFGIERCMFASNFPMDKVSLSLNTLLDAYQRLVADRPLAEQRAIFRDNALRFYSPLSRS